MEPLLDIRDLTVGYEAPVLSGISFSACPGEVVGILGRNGCGKTTLLRGILGSVRRFGGEVRAAGHSCGGLPPRKQARLLSLLPQQTLFLEGITVREAIEMGRYPYGGIFRSSTEADERAAAAAADRLQIRHLLDADCARLSQGQRQLVMLARLLAQDTPVMLLDEPNTSLDYDNIHTMFALIRSLVRDTQKTAVLVLHDPEQALAWCDRLLILKDGGLCRDIVPGQLDAAAVTDALQQIYPSITVRKDSYSGCFRCYDKERSLC